MEREHRRRLIGLLKDPTSVLDVPGPEWPGLVTFIQEQACAALLLHRLRESGAAEALPEDAADRLRRAAAAITARSLLLVEETCVLVEGLEEGGIPVIPVRGVALSDLLYRDPTLRPSGDIDLIVPAERLDALPAFFQERGYRVLDRREGFSRAWYYTLKFYRERLGWLICEPHWSLGYPPFLQACDMAGVWARAVRRLLLGKEMRALAPEDLLLHLAWHYIHHHPGAPLLWAYELDRVARGAAGAIDGKAFVERAGQGAPGVLARRALTEAADRFGPALSPEVLEALPREAGDPTSRRLLRVVTAPGGVDGRESLATFLALPGIRNRTRYLVQLLFPSPRFMRVEYELRWVLLLPLAYMRRLGYFLFHGVRGMFALIGRG